jgi:hypothetical protein
VLLYGCSSALAAAPARMTFIAAAATSGASPELMLAHADGSAPQALGPANTAVLSPNGQLVAAVAPGAGSPAHGSSLVLYTLGSKKPPRTLSTSAAQLTILAWAPDDHWIAVTDGDSLFVVGLHGAVHKLATGTISGASFAPNKPDRLVFAKAASLLVGAAVNLYTVALSGGAPVAITTDGLSEYPIWGPHGIVFSREASQSSTTLELWLLRPGRSARQLTDVTVSAGYSGLEPVALSQNGTHLLANLVGEQASQAWCIDLSSNPVAEHAVALSSPTTIGNAISRNGSEVLLTEEATAPTGDDVSNGSVVVLPWAGVAATTVVMHGAFASWNR